MSTMMNYDLPLLDFDTLFSFWQVKMRVAIVHHNHDEALGGFRKKDQKIGPNMK
jgi:hypothetical protein